MLPEPYRWIEEGFEPEGDPHLLRAIARDLAAAGDLAGAATVYDRAFGIAPEDEAIAAERAGLLDRLAVIEHGLRFRYVPGGPFLMGSRDGDPDETPLHPVWVSPYWISDTPVSWAAYCALMGWSPPPEGTPPEEDDDEEERAGFHLHEANKIRLQYCEDQTTEARDWHAHAPGQVWQSGAGTQTSQELFGAPARDDPEAAWSYATKPMVAVGWQEAEELAAP
ncbi:MAG: SUMF1/EgtB/PvdO family nonheme iron enzyme [Gemmataceae bacterium]